MGHAMHLRVVTWTRVARIHCHKFLRAWAQTIRLHIFNQFNPKTDIHITSILCSVIQLLSVYWCLIEFSIKWGQQIAKKTWSKLIWQWLYRRFSAKLAMNSTKPTLPVSLPREWVWVGLCRRPQATFSWRLRPCSRSCWPCSTGWVGWSCRRSGRTWSWTCARSVGTTRGCGRTPRGTWKCYIFLIFMLVNLWQFCQLYSGVFNYIRA